MDRAGPSQRTAVVDAIGALLLAAACGGALAQASRPLEFSGGASVGLSATDNQGLTATGPRAEATLSAGVDLHLRARSGRVQGFVDYALTGRHFTRNTEADDFQNALNGLMTAELVDRRVFVDVAGQISQQRRSVFGPSSPDTSLGTGNLTEVRTFRIEPRAAGPLGSFGAYDARLGQTSTTSSQDATQGVDTTSGQLGWNSARLLGRTQVGARLNGNIYRFETGRRQTQAQARLLANWSPDNELTLRVSGGRELNDFRTVERVGNALYGAGLRWLPTPRTVFDLDAEHQYFGTAHRILLSHRLPRLSFQFVSSRSVVAPDAQRAQGIVGSAFDVWGAQVRSAAQQQNPDLVLTDAQVEQIIRDQILGGRDPRTTFVQSDFLTSSLSLQRRHELAIAWQLLRQSVTVTLGSSDDRRASTVDVPLLGDAFSRSAVIRQRFASLAVAHRLSPTDTLGFDMALLQTLADGDGLDTRTTSYGLSWSGQWTRTTQVSFGARHAEGRGAQPYQASSLYTTLRTQF